MNYKRLFYNWLQKEHIYSLFFSNVATDRTIVDKFSSGKKKFEYIVKLLGKDPKAYISSFIWIHTYQGYYFWSMKCSKWTEYLDKWKRTH